MSRILMSLAAVAVVAAVIFVGVDAAGDPCPVAPPTKSCFECSDGSFQNDWWCPKTLQCFKSSDDCDHGCDGGNCVASSSNCPTYCGCCVSAGGSYCATALNATGFCFDSDTDCQKGCTSTCYDPQPVGPTCPPPSDGFHVPSYDALKAVRGKSSAHIRTIVAESTRSKVPKVHPQRDPSDRPASCDKCVQNQEFWCPGSEGCFNTARDCQAGCSAAACFSIISQCPTQCTECFRNVTNPTAYCPSQNYCYDYSSDCTMGTCGTGCITDVNNCPSSSALPALTKIPKH